MRFKKNIFAMFDKKDNGQEKSSKDSSGKPELRNLLGDISGILDPLDMEVIVVKSKECKVVFTNTRAEVRMYNARGYASFCKSGYAMHFHNLCDHCPYGGIAKGVGHGPFEIEDKDKRKYTIRSSTINWIDNKPAAVLVLRDITAEVETNKRLYTLAYYDQLTSVPNRQRLRDDFNEVEERIAKNELSGIVALFDLDYFKAVNDTYGHNMGDIVLCRLTEHLQGEKAFKGHIYRLGGDEFVLLYLDPADRFKTEQDIKSHYSGLLSAALRAYTLPNTNVKCTLSMGVSVFPSHGATLSEVLRKADIALYQAKAGGRNQIVFFTEQGENAQELNDMHINIQPVLNGSGGTFGYELTDRGIDGDIDEMTVSLNEFSHPVIDQNSGW